MTITAAIASTGLSVSISAKSAVDRSGAVIWLAPDQNGKQDRKGKEISIQSSGGNITYYGEQGDKNVILQGLKGICR